jgi:hypothetical protein
MTTSIQIKTSSIYTNNSLPSLGTLGNSNRSTYRLLIESRLSCSLRRTFPNPLLTPLDFRWATGCACLHPSNDRRFAPSRLPYYIPSSHILLFRSRNYPSRQWFPTSLKSTIDTIVRLSPNMSNHLSYYYSLTT